MDEQSLTELKVSLKRFESDYANFMENGLELISKGREVIKKAESGQLSDKTMAKGKAIQTALNHWHSTWSKIRTRTVPFGDWLKSEAKKNRSQKN